MERFAVVDPGIVSPAIGAKELATCRTRAGETGMASFDTTARTYAEPSPAAMASVVATVGAATAVAVISEVIAEVASSTAVAAAQNVFQTTLCASQQANLSYSYQPLADILFRYPVPVPASPTDQDIRESIAALDRLILALQECVTPHAGHAPGFETRTDPAMDLFTGRVWSSYKSYQVLCGSSHRPTKNVVPLPTPAAALKNYQQIRAVWEELLKWAEAVQKNERETTETICSCISKWGSSRIDTLGVLANQVLEQAMVKEASACIHSKLASGAIQGFHKGQVWDRMYSPDLCPTPEETDHWYTASVPIRFIRDRDEYAETFCRMALASRATIKLCTSYLFAADPANRYFLLDLLPYMVKTHGVKVQVIFDLLTIESAIMRSAFTPTKANENNSNTSAAKDAGKNPVLSGKITATSFLDKLPPGSPPLERGLQEPGSTLDFLNHLLEVAENMPDNRFQIRWWCARDAESKYRIKNHAKCSVFDQNVAFIGGSNILPTLTAASSDCDLLVVGDMARRIDDTFCFLWDGLEAPVSADLALPINIGRNDEDEEEKKIDDIAADFEKQDSFAFHKICEKWDDEDCKVALVRSNPTADGEDAILRAVLGAIKTAKSTITMCFGHCNVPFVISVALREACKSGVRVRLMVNSQYSTDLCTGQRDLFLSLRDLLEVAPEVEVYTTAVKNGTKPAFLHSKYMVVDGEWSAVGSWNMWTRSAFYEMEHELLIFSTEIANYLEGKFERESAAAAVRLNSCQECCPGNEFCPIGCSLCTGFGPFFS